MSNPYYLTASGATAVSVPLGGQAVQIVGLLARADNTEALEVKVYLSATAVSDGTVPSGARLIADIAAPSGGSIPLSLSPDGIDGSGYLVAAFADSGTAHALTAYVK